MTAICPGCQYAFDMDKYVIEYGVLRLKSNVSDPEDYTKLTLDAIHPGIDDRDYVARRNWLFDLTRKNRLENLGPPVIDFTAEENGIWKLVYPELEELHNKYAHSIYLEGKKHLGMPRDRGAATQGDQHDA